MAAISIGSAARQAGVDLYFNSLRFVPANAIWAALVMGTLFVAALWPPSVILLVFSAVPLAGIHRLAALLARGEAISLSDVVDGMRRFGIRAAIVGAAAASAGIVLVTNVLIGFGADGPLGWFIGASALWGVLALSMGLVVIWPVLVDPRRERLPLRRQLQLAALVVIGRPAQVLVLTTLIAAVLVASTILLGAIVLVGVAYSSLLATRWVLPAADELEARYEAARAR